MSYEKEVALDLVQQIKAAGFRPFLAKCGTYGFYTDKEGTRVVSFGVRFGGAYFSGNYKTNRPQKTGTGWRMDDKISIEHAFEAYAPKWAVGGAEWRYTTLEEQLKMYQASSEYEEVTDET